MKQSTEKIWAMITHFGAALLGPFSGVSAMVIFLVFKDRSKYIAHHSHQAMWFFFCIWIASFIAGVLHLGFLVYGLWILQLILAFVGSFNALSGKWYEYPVTSKVARRALN